MNTSQMLSFLYPHHRLRHLGYFQCNKQRELKIFTNQIYQQNKTTKREPTVERSFLFPNLIIVGLQMNTLLPIYGSVILPVLYVLNLN